MTSDAPRNDGDSVPIAHLNLDDLEEPLFSRTSAGDISFADFGRWQEGEITPEELLRRKLEVHDEPPPSAEEIREFERSLTDQQEHFQRIGRTITDSISPLKDAASRLGIDFVGLTRSKPPSVNIGESLVPKIRPHIPPVDAPPMLDLRTLRIPPNPLIALTERMADQQQTGNQLIQALADRVVDDGRRSFRLNLALLLAGILTLAAAVATLIVTVAHV